MGISDTIRRRFTGLSTTDVEKLDEERKKNLEAAESIRRITTVTQGYENLTENEKRQFRIFHSLEIRKTEEGHE